MVSGQQFRIIFVLFRLLQSTKRFDFFEISNKIQCHANYDRDIGGTLIALAPSHSRQSTIVTVNGGGRHHCRLLPSGPCSVRTDARNENNRNSTVFHLSGWRVQRRVICVPHRH